jgi:1,2-diacylglycerol 3-beta-galactosyltransferase
LQPEKKLKIMFLFSDTGGGHRSAAEAIIEAIELEFPGRTSCEMVDFFKQYSPPPFNRAPQIYPSLSRMPRVWGAGYRISNGNRRTRAFYTAIWPYIQRWLRRLVDEHPCDLIVSVHQVTNIPVSAAAAARHIPFITVVTDMVSTHAAWYAPRATHIIVPTHEAFIHGLENKIRSEQMTVVGMPVADRFAHAPGNREEFRSRQGWPPGRTMILMVGGGEGVGPLEAMATALDRSGLPVALAVVTGRNKALRDRLEHYTWQIPAFNYGFVTEMPQLMHAADILITKAGPGTISEAFIAGLPLILYSKMPGQEDGNVTFVLTAGAGVWAPEPAEMVAAVRYWLEHPAECAEAARISRSLARPDAARQIARILIGQSQPA